MDFKYYDLQKWAWESDIKPSQRKFVLVCLTFHCDNTGSCFPHISTIADETGQGNSTVRKHLAALEKDGYITRERQRYESGFLGGYRYFMQCSNRALGDIPTAQIDNSYRSNQADNKDQLKTNINSKKRAHRLPDGWIPPDNLTEFYLERGLTPEIVKDEYDSFCDYWRSIDGPKARKLDWVATWRNWIRRSYKIKGASDARKSANNRTKDNTPLGQNSDRRRDAMRRNAERDG